MGCFPVGKMVSKALWKCEGRRNHSPSTRMVYSPPPYSYARSMEKHVTFNLDTPMVAVPVEPTQMVPPISKDHPGAATSPPPQAEMIQQPREQCRVRFPPGPDYPSEPVNATRLRPAQVRFAAEAGHYDNFPHPSQKEQPHLRSNFEMNAAGHLNQNEPTQVHTSLDGYRYMTSPLPRWEEGERRREYFGSEYHSYPTPVREGIYRIATDPNRLTTIFSEENPNACSIV